MANPKRQGRLPFCEDEDKSLPDQSAESVAEAPTNFDADNEEVVVEVEQDDASDLRGRTVYVVDAHSLIYQVFHAMPNMTGPRGQPIGAVQGFVRDVIDLMERKQPDFLFCAFDAPGATFRHELYQEYKIQREAMPDDLRPQIQDIHRMLEAMNVATLQLATFEADDILATLAEQVEQRGGNCVLVTSDKDCRQLISEQSTVYNIRKNQMYGADELMSDWGIRPDQVVDFQSLVGDSVDNVPGVALIGPKIARELLEKYDTLEGVLDNASELTGKKRRENLMNGREVALLSRELVQLRRDVPIDIDWAAGKIGEVDKTAVETLCQEFGFRSLAERLLGSAPKEVQVEWQAEYRTIATPKELAWLVEQLAKQTMICVDTETTSTFPRMAEIVGYALAWEPGHAYYLPVRAPEGDPQLPPDQVRDALKPLLEDPAIGKVGQNLKYDIVVLRSAGIDLRGLAFDTMVADYLLSPGERNHSMDDLAKRYLNHATIKISELIGTGKNQKRMDEVPVEDVTPYAAEDADVPLRLTPLLKSRLEDDGLTELFEQLELPLIEVLAELEFNGIRVDVKRCQELSKSFGERMIQVEKEIYELAGHPFNIASLKQLAEVLFDELELPVIKRTKTGRSTNAEVLNELASLHPLPKKLIEYRQFSKLTSTYTDALPKLVHPQTGRVHGSFSQDIAATGRLSSRDPNLQNIPIRTPEGRDIRSAFLPAEGCLLLTADYSQIELRVLAHFAEDAALQAAFFADEDIHTRVASEVYDVPLEEVDSSMRRSAKAINFGIIYGQSPFGLAKALGIDQDDAKAFIDAYFARYPGVDQFMLKVLEQSSRTGYVSTISGRRRAIQGVRDPSGRGDSRQRNLPERIAINTVIQGSAADLIKQAMIDVMVRLRAEKRQSRMLLQIHDELVFEVPPNELDEMVTLVNDCMANVRQLAVPLKVDIKTGENWAACEPLH